MGTTYVAKIGSPGDWVLISATLTLNDAKAPTELPLPINGHKNQPIIQVGD